MRHLDRRHRVLRLDTPERVAGNLFSDIHPLCHGVGWASLALLNDSDQRTWEDQKYAVIQHGKQIEELTLHMMTPYSVRDEIVDLDREGSPTYLGPVLSLGNHPDDPCPLCEVAA